MLKKKLPLKKEKENSKKGRWFVQKARRFKKNRSLINCKRKGIFWKKKINLNSEKEGAN